MILAAHQLQYMPGLRFLAKMRRSDLFVLLDDVQYERREFQNRNRIRVPAGPQYLTVPVLAKGRFDSQIRDIPVDNSRPWAADHLRSIRTNYSRAPYFKAHLPALEELYGARYERLGELALATINFLRDGFGIKTPMRPSSEFAVKSVSTARLVDICRAAGADEYLSGAGARDYLDEKLFSAAGIKVSWQKFEVKPYEQAFPGFTPDLSALDLLLNIGPSCADLL
ncbi:MAG: WbqC family protein [Elusimicrobiota bacterium]